jgi:hypothetical protein
MIFNTEHNVFCTIVEIGANNITIESNGHIYISTLDKIIMFK